MFALVAVLVVIVAVLLSNWPHSEFSCHSMIIAYLERVFKRGVFLVKIQGWDRGNAC